MRRRGGRAKAVQIRGTYERDSVVVCQLTKWCADSPANVHLLTDAALNVDHGYMADIGAPRPPIDDVLNFKKNVTRWAGSAEFYI